MYNLVPLLARYMCACLGMPNIRLRRSKSHRRILSSKAAKVITSRKSGVQVAMILFVNVYHVNPFIQVGLLWVVWW